MLAHVDAVPNLAVRDVKAASRFYEDTLGLTRVGAEGDELIAYRSGGTLLYVYRSNEAGTNKATAVTWTVGDLDAEVEALKQKGVSFEHYELPGLRLQGDIHVGGDMKVAWFKDPDGNILSLASR
jgi:catechol 2,3-dioxygenase-like lactoylglutathione lyase family enzyme